MGSRLWFIQLRLARKSPGELAGDELHSERAVQFPLDKFFAAQFYGKDSAVRCSNHTVELQNLQ